MFCKYGVPVVWGKRTRSLGKGVYSMRYLVLEKQPQIKQKAGETNALQCTYYLFVPFYLCVADFFVMTACTLSDYRD